GAEDQPAQGEHRHAGAPDQARGRRGAGEGVVLGEGKSCCGPATAATYTGRRGRGGPRRPRPLYLESQGEPMRLSQLTAVPGLAAALALAGAARAETKVELKGVHLCCPGCTKAVGDILKKVDDVKGTCDQKAGTVTITAKDDEAAKKALQALADGGFHGDTGNKDLAIKDDGGATKGRGEKLTLTGVHNGCRACCKGIKDTVKKVEGVKGDTAEPKKDTFEVTGDFDAEELVKA